MKSLDDNVKAVFNATTLEEKRAAMKILIKESHAKPTKKQEAYSKIEKMNKETEIDKYAVCYSLAGEGLRVG